MFCKVEKRQLLIYVCIKVIKNHINRVINGYGFIEYVENMNTQEECVLLPRASYVLLYILLGLICIN